MRKEIKEVLLHEALGWKSREHLWEKEEGNPRKNRLAKKGNQYSI